MLLNIHLWERESTICLNLSGQKSSQNSGAKYKWMNVVYRSFNAFILTCCVLLGVSCYLRCLAGITWRVGVWTKSRRRRSELWIQGTIRRAMWASQGRRRGIVSATETGTGTTTANHPDTVARAAGMGGDAAVAALVIVALTRYERRLVSFHHASFFFLSV